MVSRAYLSAWGDDRRRIDVIDLEAKRGYVTTYDRATVVSYAYETSFLEGTNLEQEYARIESAGIRGIVRLRNGEGLTLEERRSVVAFLDMHLERGRYADQTKVRTPAVAVLTEGGTKDVELALADRLMLSRYMEGAWSLRGYGLETWEWTLRTLNDVATGDGAVLCFSKPGTGNELGAVLFPVSPTQVLMIGELPPGLALPLNGMIAERSRRWLVSTAGSLNMDPALFEELGAPR